MEKNYLFLFNEITDIISTLDEMKEHLIKVQQECEEKYLSAMEN